MIAPYQVSHSRSLLDVFLVVDEALDRSESRVKGFLSVCDVFIDNVVLFIFIGSLFIVRIFCARGGDSSGVIGGENDSLENYFVSIYCCIPCGKDI